MAMRQPAGEFRRHDAGLENPFLARKGKNGDIETSRTEGADAAYMAMAEILRDEGYVESIPTRFLEHLRRFRPMTCQSLHVVRREDPFVLFNAIVHGRPLTFRLDPQKLEELRVVHQSKAEEIVEDIRKLRELRNVSLDVDAEISRLENEYRAHAAFVERPMYANAALWSLSRPNGLSNALVEGFTSHRGIASVVGFVPGPDIDVGRSAFISRTQAQMDRSQNCSLSGDLPTDQVAFIVLSGKADRFPERMLSDAELEQVEENPRNALRIRYFVLPEKKTPSPDAR